MQNGDREKIENALKKVWYNTTIIESILNDILLSEGFTAVEGSRIFLIKKYNKNSENRLIVVNPTANLLTHINGNEKKGTSDSTHLEEIFKVIKNQGTNNSTEITIISAYNKDENHWLSHVIKIKKAKDNSYECNTYLHDPFGGGQFQEKAKQAIVKEAVRAFLGGQASVKFEFPISSYTKRQYDGCSCGVITAEEIWQLANTGEIKQKKYPEGALDLRKQHLMLLNMQYDNARPGGFKAMVTKIKAKNILSTEEYKLVKKKARKKVENVVLNQKQEDEIEITGSSYEEGELEALQSAQTPTSQQFNEVLEEEATEIKIEKLRSYANQLYLEDAQENITATIRANREEVRKRSSESSTAQEIAGNNNNHFNNLKGAFMPFLVAGILLMAGAASAYINKQKGNIALYLTGITAIIVLLTSIVCTVLLLVKPVETSLKSSKLEGISLPKVNEKS